MAPSTRSEKTKAVITSTPANSQPCGKNTSAPATTPAVPTRVTASGDTPQRRRRSTTGVKTLVQKARKRSSMARSGYRPRGGEQVPRLPEQLREGLRPADDRHEVLVAGPAWDHVLVQVRSDARPRDRALVHADVEPVGAAHGAD